MVRVVFSEVVTHAQRRKQGYVSVMCLLGLEHSGKGGHMLEILRIDGSLFCYSP